MTAVRPARERDCAKVAAIHKSSLPGSFLGTLPVSFLTVLYTALCRWERGVLLVAEENGELKGFLSGTADTSAFFAYFKKTCFFRAGFALLPALLRKGTCARMRETIRYGRTGEEGPFPEAELLSIAVAGDAQRQGLGRRLFDAFTEWCAAGKIEKFKVVTGEHLEAAHRFYLSCGCRKEGECRVHGQDRSLIYVCETGRKKQ